MCSDRILRGHMNWRHEPTRLVGSDWQQGQSRRPKPLTDLGEMNAERGVPGEIDDSVFAADDVPAPESFIAVENSPAREMQGRNAMNRRCIDLPRLTPIEFVNGLDPFGPKELGYANRNDEYGVAAPREPP